MSARNAFINLITCLILSYFIINLAQILIQRKYDRSKQLKYKPYHALFYILLSFLIFFNSGSVTTVFTRFFVLFNGLILIAFIDLCVRKIPNIIVAPLGAYLFLTSPSILSPFITTCLLFISVRLTKTITSSEVIGGGDLKLFFMLSFYFNVEEILILIMLCCAFGIFAFILMPHLKEKGIPFAPFIGIAAYLIGLWYQ